MGKITDEELQKINQVKQETMEIAYGLGELEFQKTTIEFLIEDVKSKVKEVKAKEAKLLNELKGKYGNVNINIETGEF